MATTEDIVSKYDEAERKAVHRLPNRAIEACKPAAFYHTNYPTQVTDTRELWRYADVMHDRRARKIFDRLGGLTQREFDLWSQSIEYASSITERLDRRIVPINAPLAAIVSYRCIKSHYATPSVFEIGPGSAYLGKLLQLGGDSYRSTDITQAFCLWQNMFLGVDQLPWWEWIDHRRADFPADVIVANHALSEMRESALRYLIVRAERMLGENGMLFVEDFGASYLRSAQQTVALFIERGWKGIHLGTSNYAFTPPHGAGLPSLRSADAPSRGWNDLETVWRGMASSPNLDDEFLDFIGSTIA